MPAHRLIPADRGTHVLLASAADGAVELHRLDLATRRARRWTTLRAGWLPPGDDGSVLTIADAGGVAFVAVDDEPRVTWRELDARHRLGRLARSAGSLAAEVTPPGATAVELWRRDLPVTLLRGRPARPVIKAEAYALLSSGDVVTLRDEGVWILRGERWQAVRHAGQATLHADGEHYAVAGPDRITLATAAGPAVAELDTSTGLAGLHARGRLVTLWDPGDRVLALDTATGAVTAAFATRLA